MADPAVSDTPPDVPPPEDATTPQPGRPAPPAPTDDGSADTQMFRAFVERDETEPPKAVGAPFRIATLLIGLAVFAGLVYLLLQL